MTTATETTRSLTARELFEAFAELGPLRVISVTGPSVFEAILDLDAFGVADGWLNAMTADYHWHVDLARVRHLTTRDTIHERSGRRVLYFELREAADAEPFLLVYLHRGKGEDFAPAREDAFGRLHGGYAGGGALGGES